MLNKSMYANNEPLSYTSIPHIIDRPSLIAEQMSPDRPEIVSQTSPDQHAASAAVSVNAVF